MKPNSERAIKKAVVKWLNLQPQTFAFVVTTTGIPDFKRKGGFRTNPNSGIADVLGVKQITVGLHVIGVPFAFEVKREKMKLSMRQRIFLERFSKAGGWSFVVHSLEEAIQSFNAITV